MWCHEIMWQSRWNSLCIVNIVAVLVDEYGECSQSSRFGSWVPTQREHGIVKVSFPWSFWYPSLYFSLCYAAQVSWSVHANWERGNLQSFLTGSSASTSIYPIRMAFSLAIVNSKAFYLTLLANREMCWMKLRSCTCSWWKYTSTTTVGSGLSE